MRIQHTQQLPTGGRLMALDHGRRTIGIAISDAQRRMAQPLSTIRYTKLTQAIAELTAIISQHQPAGLIIGYPLQLDGSEGPRCQSVRAFVRTLEAQISLPMLLWDERLSSAAARDALADAGLGGRAIAQRVDAAAAALILESLLAQL